VTPTIPGQHWYRWALEVARLRKKDRALAYSLNTEPAEHFTVEFDDGTVITRDRDR
jgi:hypothetical protein